MNQNIALALKDWLPYRLIEESDGAYCRWLYMGNYTFDEPFFDQTISKCRGLFENSQLKRSVSQIDVLPQWSQGFDSIAPTAIIFHVSRCGSTVISQLLGLNSTNIILSEVPFIDELLRLGVRNKSVEAIIQFVESAIKLYGAKRNNSQQNLFIKTDSWHVHFYEHYRQLYPDSPFIFLYRRPDEVIRSQQQKRGMQAVPSVLEAEIFGFDKQVITSMPLDEYMAMVIETYFEAFLEIIPNDPLAIAVNYNEGMVNIVQKIAAASGITIAENELFDLRKRTTFHGKHPTQVFAEKQIEVLPPRYLDKCFELYNELEKIRLRHRPTS